MSYNTGQAHPMIGQTLSHYRINGKLGEGGMGVVYQAVDTRLDRTVAIKVLHSEAVADPERKRRFVQEAKAASALNHPNIVTIYEIDEAESGGKVIDLIVMEYIPGKTVDQLIGRGGLRVNEALRYVIPMADALARAHGAGIVHRDLKPANLMVNEHGLVKILDFGLAKLTERTDGDDAATRDIARTEEGAIVGTAAYMSPEQAEGKKVDARSDIFSFGSVLYEMVTGQRAFQGETRMSTLAAILHREPKALSEVAAGIPRDLEKIIARCLRKDPARRFQHAIDLKVALEEVKEESESSLAPVAGTDAKGSRLRLVPAGLVGAALILAVAGVLWWNLRTKTAEPGFGPVLARLTADSGLTTDPALSPDGKLLAYASDRSGDSGLDIWVQQVPRGEAIRVTRDEADDHEPSFSPDGQRIVFRSDREGGGVYVVSALGGEPRLVARQGRRPRFSPDGSKIAYWVGVIGGVSGGVIYVVDSSGGSPRRLAADLDIAQSPTWSPDGKHLLFMGRRTASQGTAGSTGNEWWIVAVDGGSAVNTRAMEASGRAGLPGPLVPIPGFWRTQGHSVVFSARLGDSANLWEIQISPKTWQVEGTPRRLTSGTGLEVAPSLGAGGVVFANLAENIDIWSLPIAADQGKPLGEMRRLTDAASAEIFPSVSSDGKKLVFQSNRSGNQDVWMKDLESGREVALTATPADETSPVISPDGSKVAYQLVENGKPSIYMIGVGTPGVAEKLCEDCLPQHSWSPQGKLLYYGSVPQALNLLDVGSGRTVELLRHSKQTLRNPRFSPDGRWISFHAITGPLTRRIFVVAFREGVSIPESEWIPVTDGLALDRNTAWSPDGNLLYFQSERDGFGCIWAQRLDPVSKRAAGVIFPVQHFHHARRSPGIYSISITTSSLVFGMGEQTGNIWMLKTGEQP